MINNKKSSIDSFESNVNVNSQEWRSNEAREMFVLLLGEYENSKRLGLHQRYKELERIISMFTSDPVLGKLKWLSECQEEYEAYVEDESAETESSCKDFISAESGASNYVEDDSLLSAKIGIQMKRFVSKMKNLSNFSALALNNSTSSIPISPTTASSPSTPSSDNSDASVISFCSTSSSSSSLRISNNCNNNSNNNSSNNNDNAPSIFVSSANSQGLPHIASFPLFKRFQSESTDSFMYSSQSFDKDITTSNISSHRCRISSSSSSLSEPDSYITFQSQNQQQQSTSSCSSPTATSNQPRNEFDKWVIKQNQIPAFEIPPLRTASNSKTNKINPDTIVPSLYLASNQNTHASEKKPTSASSPNLSRFFGSINDKLSDCSSSNSTGFAAKIKRAVQRDSKSEQSFYVGSISDCSDSSYNANFDIQKGHLMLMKVKEEYEELTSWNVLSRYMKMKKMLKGCVKLDTLS